MYGDSRIRKYPWWIQRSSLSMVDYCYRLMGDEREQTVSDCQKRILTKEDEVQSLSSRCRDVEDRLSISDKQCIELRQEVSCSHILFEV